MNKEVNNLLDRIINVGYTRLSDKLQLEQCIELAKEIKLKDMNKEREALKKILEPLHSPRTFKEMQDSIFDATDIATEALEQSEPRMFSESQVLRIMERVDTEAGQTDKIGEWCHVHGSGKKYTTKKILDLLIQSLSPTK